MLDAVWLDQLERAALADATRTPHYNAGFLAAVVLARRTGAVPPNPLAPLAAAARDPKMAAAADLSADPELAEARRLAAGIGLAPDQAAEYAAGFGRAVKEMVNFPSPGG